MLIKPVKEKTEKSDDKVFVDLSLLFWAYLKIGIIEAIGNLSGYFVVFGYNGITSYDAVIIQCGAGSPTFCFFNGRNYAQNYLAATGKPLSQAAQKQALGQVQPIIY